MKLKDAREEYYGYTGKLSDVNRQLAFAGIAVVWIFAAADKSGSISLPENLVAPLACFVIALAADLLHYVSASAMWGLFHRQKEKSGIGEDADFMAPAWINYPSISFFWAKAFVNLIGFVLLLGVVTIAS